MSRAAATSSTLFLRPLDQFEGHRVAGGTGSEAAYHPFFSPDGQWLGYVTPQSLKKVSVTGGSPITLCELDRSRGASWGPDGTIVFAPSSDTGLSVVPATGGETEVADDPRRSLGRGQPPLAPVVAGAANGFSSPSGPNPPISRGPAWRSSTSRAANAR